MIESIRDEVAPEASIAGGRREGVSDVLVVDVTSAAISCAGFEFGSTDRELMF